MNGRRLSLASASTACGIRTLRLHVKNGARLHVVALNLGHVNKDGQPDVRMVTRHYAHLEKSDVAAAIRKTAPKFGFKLDSNVVPLAR